MPFSLAKKHFFPTQNKGGRGILITSLNVGDDYTKGTLVGSLSVFGEAGPWTFSLVNDAGDMFDLTGNDILIGSVEPNRDIIANPVITVRASSPNVTFDQNITFLVRKPLPALPLPTGAKVLGFGNSFIQRSAANDQNNLHQYNSYARGVLTWLEQLHLRYNLDKFSDAVLPFQPSTDNYWDGSLQGNAERHLLGDNGTIALTPYVLEKNPDIIYLVIGLDDVNTGITGAGTPATAKQIIEALTTQLQMFRNEGKYVVAETITHSVKKSEGGPWDDNDARIGVVNQVNDWLQSQNGVDGVYISDLRIWGFNYPVIDLTLFDQDKVHMSTKGALVAQNSLVQILQTMVASGDRYNTDWTVSNLWPNASLLGAAGIMEAANGASLPTGSVADNYKVRNSILWAQSSIVCSKEVGSAGVWEKQIITVTPNAAPSPSGGDTRVHQVDLRMANPFTLAGNGLAAGDWVDVLAYVELSAWDYWLESKIGTVFLQGAAVVNEKAGGLLNPDRLTQRLAVPATGFAGWLKLTSIQVPAGADSIDVNQLLSFQFDRTGTGSGTIKISRPIIRKRAFDPQSSWSNGILLSNFIVDDDAAPGKVVGSLSVRSDVGTGPWTYTLVDAANSQFAIQGTNLIVGVGELNRAIAPNPFITIRATNGTVTLTERYMMTVRRGLPTLPLPLGAKVGAIGDSHIGYSALPFSSSITDTTSGRAGMSTCVGFLHYAAALDQRFRHDMWFDLTDPMNRNVAGYNNAKPGDHLEFNSATFLNGIIPRLKDFAKKNFDLIIIEGGTNTLSSGDDGQASPNYVIKKLDQALRLARDEGLPVILMCLYRREDWPLDDVRQLYTAQVNNWIKAQAGRDGVFAIWDFSPTISPSGSQDPLMFLPDKVHLSNKGALAVTKNHVLPTFRQLILPGKYLNLDAGVDNLYPASLAQLQGTTGTISNFTGSNPYTGTNPATGVTISRGRNISVAGSKVDLGDGYFAQRLDCVPGGTDNGEYYELTISGLDILMSPDPNKWYRGKIEFETFDPNISSIEVYTSFRQGTTPRAQSWMGQRLSSSNFIYTMGDTGKFTFVSHPMKYDPAWGTADRMNINIRITGPKTAPAVAFQISRPKIFETDDPRPLMEQPVAVDQNRFMFFASRNRQMSGFIMPAAPTANYFASKLKFGSADYRTWDMRLHFAGRGISEGGNAPAEDLVAGNDMVIDGVDLVLRGKKYPAVFYGQAGFVVVSGSSGGWCSFPTAPKLRKRESFEIITRWHVAEGQNFVAGYRIQKHRGEKFWAAADPASLQTLIDTNAPVTVSLDTAYNTIGNQSNSQQLAYGPDIMVAKGDWDGRPVVLALTDSIGHSRQEIAASADERGTMGIVSRYFDSALGLGRVPHFIMGTPGSASVRTLATGAFQTWDVLEEVQDFNNGRHPFTSIFNQQGYNDNNSTLSTWTARMSALDNRAVARMGSGIPVLQGTITPRNSTTGSYLTQDVITPQDSTIWGTNRNSVNSDIRGNVAPYALTGVLDIDQAMTNYPVTSDTFKAALPLGQLGTMLSLTPGDGSSLNPVGVLDFEPNIGFDYLVEYQPGLYAGRTVLSYVNNGNGTYTATFANNYTTVFQANAKVYNQISPDGTHPTPTYILNWVMPRLSPNKKAKFVVTGKQPVIYLSNRKMSESALVNAVVGNLSVVDGTGVYTFTKTADTDGKFAISGNSLVLAATLDYETKTLHTVTVQADNGAGSVITRTFYINVLNEYEGVLGPTTATFSSDTAEVADLFTITGLDVGGAETIVSVSPNDGRVRIEGGNKIIRGSTAVTAGTFNVTLTTSGGRTLPVAITVFDRPIVALPALPLTQPKVMGFGHSFVLNNTQYLYLAGNTATNGANGVATSGRGVLSQVEVLDGGRYNLDVFAEYTNLAPGMTVSGGQGVGGRSLARGGAGMKIWGSGLTLDMNTDIDYLIARAPQIVVIDIGVNDLIYAFTNGGTIQQILGLYQAMVRRIRNAGIWCILQTLSWSDTTPFPASNPTCVDWKLQLNNLIISMGSEPGIKVCNTMSFDGQDTNIGTFGTKYFLDSTLHPTDKLNLVRAETLIPILQSMTTPAERRDLDELTGNLLPNPGLTGTTGTKTGTATTGNVATGMTFAGPNTGTTQAVLSKEVISGQSEKQVIQFTNNAPGGTTSTYTLRPSAAGPLLSAAGLVAGDKLRFYATVELDDWAGWDFDGQADGPVKLQLPLYNNTTLVYQGTCAVSMRNRTVILTGILEIPVGLTADRISWQSAFITFRVNNNVAGSGTAKISKLKVMKATSNPRTPWNL